MGNKQTSHESEENYFQPTTISTKLQKIPDEFDSFVGFSFHHKALRTFAFEKNIFIFTKHKELYRINSDSTTIVLYQNFPQNMEFDFSYDLRYCYITFWNCIQVWDWSKNKQIISFPSYSSHFKEAKYLHSLKNYVVLISEHEAKIYNLQFDYLHKQSGTFTRVVQFKNSLIFDDFCILDMTYKTTSMISDELRGVKRLYWKDEFLLHFESEFSAGSNVSLLFSNENIEIVKVYSINVPNSNEKISHNYEIFGEFIFLKNNCCLLDTKNKMILKLDQISK
eukprot:gene10494-3015_t